MATSPILGLAAAALLVGVLPGAAQQVTAPVNRDRRVITAEEIEQASSTDAYQVVEKLRPEFLRRMSRPQSLGAGASAGGSSRGSMSRGAGAGGGVPGNGSMGGDQSQQPDPGLSQPNSTPMTAVFVDGTQMGGIEELRLLHSNLVEEIRYLSGPDAEIKYGPRFAAGVIEVKLKNH
jgi:hypothetical protein